MPSSGLRELQNFTAISKYARWLKDKQRRETWLETTGRFRGMMLDRFPQLKSDIDWAFDAVDNRDVLGSQRALQFAGHPIVQHNARIFNCSGSYVDRLRFFPEAFYLLLCGCGVGFSVQEHHIQHLPRFSRKRLLGVTLPRKTFRAPDTIEGWADCHAAMLSSYHEEPIRGFEEYMDCEVDFDLTGIRLEGAELSFGIGVAPGPKPLALSISRNRDLLNRAISEGLTKLNSIYAFDYAMHEADAVVSGGVRRAATICLFDLWDDQMGRSKIGNWIQDNPQRQRANISASLLRGSVAYDAFRKLIEFTRQFGEPGFYWTNHRDMLPNPCVEIGFWAKLLVELTSPIAERVRKEYQGPWHRDESTNNTVAVSGWQFCNLSTINGKTVRDEADYLDRCRKAALIGVLQKSFTSFPYLGEVSEVIAKHEALLGVSIAGIMHNPSLLLNPEVQQRGAAAVLETDAKYSVILGLNLAARSTCIKPDGNSASLLGTFSGIHAGKFRRGFRIVRAGVNETPYQHFHSINPGACEPVLHENGGHKTDVIRFCCEYEGVLEEEMSAIDMLAAVKSTYLNWVSCGKRPELCTQPWLSHNVSNTVRVRPDEWEAVAKYIFENQECFSGVSLISSYGDRDYAQAPFTTVYTKEQLTGMYSGDALEYGTRLVAYALEAFGHLWTACAAAMMDGSNVSNAHQHEWLSCFADYATDHFNGDKQQATYCLKDVFNYSLWSRLKDSYRDVDYGMMREATNGTSLMSEPGCAGGNCEL